MTKRRSRGWPLAMVVLAFSAGVLVDSVLRTYGPPRPAIGEVRLTPDATWNSQVAPKPESTTDSQVRLKPESPRDSQVGLTADAPIENHIGPAPTSGTTSLRLPIEGMDLDAVKDGFNERRGDHPHEAVDILAPRNTPIHAVESGTIAKIFLSKQGGRTIYQFDPSGRLCYYYAHLERYADGLHEGQAVAQGQIIGYVGTSGNAPPNTPHLHFAVIELGDDKKWWKGQAIDPYPLLKRKANG